MNCPVCNTSVTDEMKVCPNCQSDLEGYQITRAMDRSAKNRFNFAVIASSLFVVVLVLWIISVAAKSDAENTSTNTEAQAVQLEKMDQLKTENDQLRESNSELRKKIAKLEEVQKKREKIYVVKNGESLFSIARKIHGNGFKYVDIAKNNNIQDPENIQTGQKLIIYY